MAGRLETQLKKKHKFDSHQQAVVIGVLRTSDLFQYQRGRLFRAHGLSQPQYNVLRILRGANSSLPCLEIAARMITKVPAITSLIDKLEKQDLVRRERDTTDRRIWNVSIIAAGKKLLKKLDSPLQEVEQSLCRGLTQAECKQLTDLMEKARAGLQPAE